MEKLIIREIPSDIQEEELCSLLPQYVIDHCHKYQNRHSRLESLFAYSVLLEETPGKRISFEKEKPDFESGELHFSLSHSHGKVAILISDFPCGVDIEKRFDRPILARKLLTPEEMEEYQNAEDRTDYLNRKWVLKEAYGKMLGIGIARAIKETVQEKDNVQKKEDYYIASFISSDNGRI